MMNSNTKTNSKITVTIHPIKNRKGNYIAFFKSEFLDSTYSLFFKDTITGAIALHNFSKMIRINYEVERIDFELSNIFVPFNNEAIIDVLKSSKFRIKSAV